MKVDKRGQIKSSSAASILLSRLVAYGLVPGILFVAGLDAGSEAAAQVPQAGDATRGHILFQQSCAICHATSLGPGNTVIAGQGPSLVGIVGRRAGTGLSFNYTRALVGSGITWDSTNLDRFLADPMMAVPGTAMPIPVRSAEDRQNLVTYPGRSASLSIRREMIRSGFTRRTTTRWSDSPIAAEILRRVAPPKSLCRACVTAPVGIAHAMWPFPATAGACLFRSVPDQTSRKA